MKFIADNPGCRARRAHAFQILVGLRVGSNRIAGFDHSLFHGAPDMAAVTPGNHLHHMIDCQLGSHLASPMSANAICKDCKNYRRSIALIQHKRRHSITVLIILARHTGMRLSIDVEMSARDTYHTDFFEVTLGSGWTGGWFRSKRYISCPKLILSPCVRRRPSRVTGSKLTHV